MTISLGESSSTDHLPGSRMEAGVSTNRERHLSAESSYTSHDISMSNSSSNPKLEPLMNPSSETLSGAKYKNNEPGLIDKGKIQQKTTEEPAKRSNGVSVALDAFDDEAISASSYLIATNADLVTIAETARGDPQISDVPIVRTQDGEGVMKPSLARKNDELTSTPTLIQLPSSSWTPTSDPFHTATHAVKKKRDTLVVELSEHQLAARNKEASNNENSWDSITATPMTDIEDSKMKLTSFSAKAFNHISRPHMKVRTASSPPLRGKKSTFEIPGTDQYFLAPSSPPSPKQKSSLPPPLQIPNAKFKKYSNIEGSIPSPMPQSIPIPPFSFATYLQLELSSHKPPPLYIHRSKMSDFPYESSAIKLERLQNFLFLPPHLELVLWFGALACLDSWLFTFTILPLRFLKALWILCQSWGRNAANEVRSILGHIYWGAGRIWRRQRRPSTVGVSAHDLSGKIGPHPKDSTHSEPPPPTLLFPSSAEKENTGTAHSHSEQSGKRRSSNIPRQRVPKFMPSALQPDHKADILKGFLIIISCTILMQLDAGKIYHDIRGQAAIKLYVIYNVLEVCDRLFSAIGQDVLECLFSTETLERRSDGRSRIWRPVGLFLLALVYNLIHATSLFYQVITLNVAVNSYSNALPTLLMSNQFVEIKSTVFKKFEKENLFQLTCADIVERFQLWLMLTIIASRNIIETGGLNLSLGLSGSNSGAESSFMVSSKGSTILPTSFTMFPVWIGQVMGPFLLVLGSEMLVDWIKHAYITKFNNAKPAIYGRFLDVLAKDYYSNAFASQNLTRRFGLPVIPLASVFIRAAIQTYRMFLTNYMPLPLASAATAISTQSEPSSPTTTAALQHIDHILRRVLGRSTFSTSSTSSSTTPPPTTSNIISESWISPDFITTSLPPILFIILLYLLLLTLKLLLGMCLLSYARRRYRSMKDRESTSSTHTEGKRIGGWGAVEVDDETRAWIYQDDVEGLERMRERAARERKRDPKVEVYEGVERYSMVGKRIW